MRKQDVTNKKQYINTWKYRRFFITLTLFLLYYFYTMPFQSGPIIEMEHTCHCFLPHWLPLCFSLENASVKSLKIVTIS